MWKEVQRTRKKSPVQLLCLVQSRQSLTTVRLEDIVVNYRKRLLSVIKNKGHSIDY